MKIESEVIEKYPKKPSVSAGLKAAKSKPMSKSPPRRPAGRGR